jgi:hypothetical protein
MAYIIFVCHVIIRITQLYQCFTSRASNSLTTATGSSADSSSSEGPDEEKPVMLEPTKSTTAADTTAAPSSGHDVDDDDDLSSSSEEADNLHRPQTPPNSANSTSHDLAFDMGKRGAAPKPEDAAAKVEETLTELKESAKSETANLIDHLS